MTSKVFISYRRDDSAGHAGRVHDRLTSEFGRAVLFMDVDAIPLGANFIKILRDEVAKCDVLLAIIGPNWLNARDEEGKRRLDNPLDFVRIEIATALQRDIPVIPILLDGAKIPKTDQLPKGLEELAVRNALDVRHASFHGDMDKLVRGLKLEAERSVGVEADPSAEPKLQQVAEPRARQSKSENKERGQGAHAESKGSMARRLRIQAEEDLNVEGEKHRRVAYSSVGLLQLSPRSILLSASIVGVLLLGAIGLWFVGHTPTTSMPTQANISPPPDSKSGPKALCWFGGKCVALVIGNSAYNDVPSLVNPENDARLFAETLRTIGFNLVGGNAQVNLNRQALEKVVLEFSAQLKGEGVGLFFYAGHAVQVRGTNYLIPTDAHPAREADIPFQLVAADPVLKQMDGIGSKLNIVILDASHNNPFPLGIAGESRVSQGLAVMQAPEGMLISFANQPGYVAADGDGGVSPFAKALAETLPKPGLSIFDAFNEVSLKVRRATGGKQVPWLSATPIDSTFYFVRASPVAAKP